MNATEKLRQRTFGATFFAHLERRLSSRKGKNCKGIALLICSYSFVQTILG